MDEDAGSVAFVAPLGDLDLAEAEGLQAGEQVFLGQPAEGGAHPCEWVISRVFLVGPVTDRSSSRGVGLQFGAERRHVRVEHQGIARPGSQVVEVLDGVGEVIEHPNVVDQVPAEVEPLWR